MCKLVDCHTNYGEICKVADIKANYISNIVNTAHICANIERIVLFGSALEERCKDISDIDILYFQNGKKINGNIMNDINEGKVIYRKNVEAC
jgi:predicted nucleotidyltransferase